MTIKLDSHITPVALREGYSSTINPSVFVNAWGGTIQAGQQLQNVGAKAFDMVLAEQNVYYSTQGDMLNTRRKLLNNELLQGLRTSRNPANLESEYRTGYQAIEKGLLKVPQGTQPHNDRIKSLVQAEGQAYFATKFPTIQKEARVYRLNGLKTGVEDTVRLMRGSLINTEDPLAKEESSTSINHLISSAEAMGIMLPSEASDELLKIDKDQEAASIRRKMNAADTIEEFDEALGQALYMDEETKEIRRDQFRTRMRE